MVIDIANLLLAPAWLATTATLLIYGLLQPWWKSWFGWSLTLTLLALWQMLSRSALVLLLGPEYAGRDWVLLLGRAEIAFSMTVAAIGFGRVVIKAWRATGSAETPRHATDGVSEYS